MCEMFFLYKLANYLKLYLLQRRINKKLKGGRNSCAFIISYCVTDGTNLSIVPAKFSEIRTYIDVNLSRCWEVTLSYLLTFDK